MTILFSTRMTDGLSVFDGVQQQPPNVFSFEEFDGHMWLKAAIVDPNVPTPPSTDRCRVEVKLPYFHYTDLYYGYRLRLPPDFKMVRGEGSWPTGCVITQLKEGERAGVSLNLKDDDFRLTVWNYYPKMAYSPSRKLPIPRLPLGEDAVIIFHVKSVEGGVLEMWVNDERVIRDVADYRLGPQDADRGRISRYMKLGLYRAYRSNPGEAYYTDAVVATSFDEVRDFITPPPEPEYCCDICGACFPMQKALDEHMKTHETFKRGCIIAFLCSSMGLSTLLPWIRQFRSHLPRSIVDLYYGISTGIMVSAHLLQAQGG